MPELITQLVAQGIIDQEAANLLSAMADPVFGRSQSEERLFNAVLTGLQNQQEQILNGIPSQGAITAGEALELFDANESLLADAFLPEAESIASETAISRAIRTAAPRALLSETALQNVFNQVNEDVLRWANDYYLDVDDSAVGSLPNLNRTSREQFLDVFTAWNRGELVPAVDPLFFPDFQPAEGLPQLIEALEPIFGAERAELIASTETTRIFGEATKRGARANVTIISLRWMTSADERVCRICGPLHGMVVDKFEDTWPHPNLGAIGFPAHPRCRCDLFEETEVTVLQPLPANEQFVFEES